MPRPLTTASQRKPASRSGRPLLRVFQPPSRGPAPAAGAAAVQALRPHQWVKNLLLLVPFLLAHRLLDFAQWLTLGAAFVFFSASASAVYLLNDLLDLDADRRHPTKHRRPLASGALSATTAKLLAASLLAAALAGSAACLPWRFTGILLLYVMATTAYSLYLKRVLFLDILVLAGLYTLRVLAGGVAASVEISDWLLAFSMFFFTSLALLKRYIELKSLEHTAEPPENRRGYLVCDLDLIQTMGPVSGYLAVLVLCLYITSPRVERLYPHSAWLWGLAPVLVYWISRLWLLARRGQIADDPVLAALRDPQSYVALATATALVLAASL